MICTCYGTLTQLLHAHAMKARDRQDVSCASALHSFLPFLWSQFCYISSVRLSFVSEVVSMKLLHTTFVLLPTTGSEATSSFEKLASGGV
jgi:hypothetical protein